MIVICPSDIRVATLHGAVKLFKANVETQVSTEIGLLALQQGARQVGQEEIAEEQIEIGDVVEDKLDKLIAEDKHERLVAVMRDIYIDGNPGDFKISDNTPKAAVVTKRFGEVVPADERNKAWEEVLRT